MALPKWIEDILSSDAVKRLVQVAVMAAVIALLNRFQTAGYIEQSEQVVTERVKKSENLVQETVEKNAVAVASAVTSSPPAEVAPIVEQAAAEVDP